MQAALTPLLLAAATAFIGWAFTELRTVFHLNVTDNAETSIRTAAATEAGKLAATVPAAADGGGDRGSIASDNSRVALCDVGHKGGGEQSDFRFAGRGQSHRLYAVGHLLT